jgi:hypothetical protein
MDEKDCSIFISHAAVDQEMAVFLKDCIGKAPPSHKVFVSSDPEELKLADEWVPKILNALESTKSVLVLATERGLSRKWVWFEAGRTWFSGVKMLPCCLGTLRKSNLPAPFSGRMGPTLTNPKTYSRCSNAPWRFSGGVSGNARLGAARDNDDSA